MTAKLRTTAAEDSEQTANIHQEIRSITIPAKQLFIAIPSIRKPGFETPRRISTQISVKRTN